MTRAVTLADDAADDEVDSALPPFGALVAALADIGAPEDEDDEVAQAAASVIAIERVSLAMSVEVEIVQDDVGVVTVRGSTPTQYTETTVMPLFHSLTLQVGVAPVEEWPNGESHGEG